VMDAFELHARSLPSRAQPTPAGLQAGSSTPANRPIRTARPPAAGIVISHGLWPSLDRTKPLAKAILVPSGDHVGCSSSARLVVSRRRPLPSAFTT
jgi:hypothetical protein